MKPTKVGDTYSISTYNIHVSYKIQYIIRSIKSLTVNSRFYRALRNHFKGLYVTQFYPNNFRQARVSQVIHIQVFQLSQLPMSICIKVDIKATQLPNFLEHQQMQSFSYNNMLNVTESTQTHIFLGEIYIYVHTMYSTHKRNLYWKSIHMPQRLGKHTK